MMKLDNMGDLADSYNQFEQEYSMFSKRIAGIQFWKYVRDYVFGSHLSEIYGFYIESNMSKVKYVEEKINCTLWNTVKEYLFNNQFGVRKRDVLILACSRKIKNKDQKFRDVYTDIIDKKLKQSHYLLDFVYDRPLPQTSKNLIYINIERFQRVLGIKNEKVEIDKSEFENELIKPLEEYYYIFFDYKRKKDMINYLQNCLTLRKILAQYYNFLLDKSKPKVILFAGICMETHILCAVAKNKGIPTVELQHGINTKSTIHYNFAKRMRISTYPDYMFTFSQAEKKCAYSISSSKVIPVGYPELDEFTRKAVRRNTSLREILIISSAEDRMLDFAEELVNRIDSSKFHVIYKLHPVEYGKKNCRNTNLEIVGDKTKMVYDYLAQAEWVVGMHSTVLYEATAFDVKIAILNSGFYEDGFRRLIDTKRANLISNVDDFLFIVDRKDINSKAVTDYFESNSMEKVQKAIDKILENN